MSSSNSLPTLPNPPAPPPPPVAGLLAAPPPMLTGQDDLGVRVCIKITIHTYVLN